MRASCNESDPGYMPLEETRQLVIFLDDVEQRFVITADTEEGIVVRHVLDADGKFQVNPSNPEEVWTETVSGVVRIEKRAT